MFLVLLVQTLTQQKLKILFENRPEKNVKSPLEPHFIYSYFN